MPRIVTVTWNGRTFTAPARRFGVGRGRFVAFGDVSETNSPSEVPPRCPLKRSRRR